MPSITHFDSNDGTSILDGGQGHWTLDDIPFDKIDPASPQSDSILVYLVAAASFVEITSALYTRNLTEHFTSAPAAQKWLTERWLPEELQHGEGLKRYALQVWPDFDWERAYRKFFGVYGALCTPQALEPDPGLELIARCVVEVGTATYYRTLAARSPEPVLRLLLTSISRDEIRHYKHFHTFFQFYAARTTYSRWRILQTLVRRIAEIEAEDSRIAIEAVRAGLPEGHSLRDAGYGSIRREAVAMLETAYPFRMAVRMLLKLLSLPQPVIGVLTPLFERTGRLALFR